SAHSRSKFVNGSSLFPLKSMGSFFDLFQCLYRTYKTIAAAIPTIENTFDNPMPSMTRPRMTQPILPEVVSLFVNCLNTTYNNQMLIPNMIIGPRFIKNTSNANNATENKRNFCITIPSFLKLISIISSKKVLCNEPEIYFRLGPEA